MDEREPLVRGVDARRVYVAGYSFGAALALAALEGGDAQAEAVRGFVGISYPWGVKSMLVPAQDPCKSEKPKLFLVGTDG
jgi:poly(3-hydroxybutyrate) depolymerase